MKKNHFRPVVRVLCAAGLLAAPGTPALASGFAITEQSVSGLGNAFAGAAASAEDASTVFFNPAGITRLNKRQFVVGLHLIRPSAKFHDSGTRDVLGSPIASGGNGGDGGSTLPTPNLYYAQPLSGKLYFGLGINAPFGLKTEYDRHWVGRYQGVKSELRTVDINPNLAWKVDDRLSVAVGFSARYADAELTNAVDVGGACYASVIQATGSLATAQAVCTTGAGLIPQRSDAYARLKGHDWGFGGNLAVLYQFGPGSRIGLSYRSKVNETLDGTLGITNLPAGVAATQNPILKVLKAKLTTGPVKAKLELPESIALSGYHELNDRWALLADITWTRWNRFRELRVVRDNGQLASLTQENWDNSLRYSLGVDYRYDDRWLLRAGVALDQSPIPDAAHRTPRLPGNDRRWVAIGASYRAQDNLRLDLGYTHLFVSNGSILHDDATNGGSGGTVSGYFDNKVDILSAQLAWTF